MMEQAQPQVEVPNITLSPRNITGSPVSTMLGQILGMAQYAAFNGMDIPKDRAGWLSLALYVVLTVLTALAGKGGGVPMPQLKIVGWITLLPMLAALGCAGMKNFVTPGTPENQDAMALISAGGIALCRGLNAGEKQVTGIVIQQIKGNPTAIAAAFQNPQQQYLVFFGPAWGMLNGLFANLVGSQYQPLLPQAEDALVNGCAMGLGLS